MSLFYFIIASIHEELKAAADNSQAEVDRANLQKYLDGDESGFLELYEQYKMGLFNLLYSYVHNQDQAEDLVQEVFMSFLKYAPSFNFKYAPSTLLFRIARNQAINLKRSAAYKRNVAVDKEYLESFQDEGNSQENTVLLKEFRSNLEAACSNLKTAVREVFFLRLDKKTPFETIGQSLGISARSAKRHFRTALDAVHDELKQNGFSLEELI